MASVGVGAPWACAQRGPGPEGTHALAQVVKLVYTPDLGSGAFRCASSSLVLSSRGSLVSTQSPFGGGGGLGRGGLRGGAASRHPWMTNDKPIDKKTKGPQGPKIKITCVSRKKGATKKGCLYSSVYPNPQKTKLSQTQSGEPPARQQKFSAPFSGHKCHRVYSWRRAYTTRTLRGYDSRGKSQRFARSQVSFNQWPF